MRILHTSDWHIGKKLKEHDRTDEYRKFFDWLAKVIADEKIDVLISAGDIFDSRNPSIESQEIYYSFLGKIAGKTCRHVIITAGNHDSPALIDAPSEVMKRCDVSVIGHSSENEIITLNDAQGNLELIVCAVPFLREDDVKDDDKNFEDSDKRIKAGIMSHYSKVFDEARALQAGFDVPIVAMGHLFLDSGKTQIDEGERTLYLGTAPKIGNDIFPDDVAYAALGHLHSPQKIGRNNIRYSGSPIVLTFGEAVVKKSVSIVDFNGKNFESVREIYVPEFQLMRKISGDMAEIEQEIKKFIDMNESVWLEVTYTGSQAALNLRERLDEIVKDSRVEVLSIRNESSSKIPFAQRETANPSDITPLGMLEKYYEEKNISEAKREIFTPLYKEILKELEIDY